MALRFVSLLIVLTLSFFEVGILFGEFVDVGHSPIAGDSQRVMYDLTLYIDKSTAVLISHPIDIKYANSLGWVLAGVAYVVLVVLQLVALFLLSKAVQGVLCKQRCRKSDSVSNVH